MTMAYVLSRLSLDAQSKFGCIITNAEHHVIGAGFNSFPAGAPDNLLPNLRPAKYPFVCHSESNALSFCSIRPVGGIVYVTCVPCGECIKRMWQEGIKKVYYIDNDKSVAHQIKNDTFSDEESKKVLIDISNIEFIPHEPDMDLVYGLVDHLIDIGYLNRKKLLNKIKKNNIMMYNIVPSKRKIRHVIKRENRCL